MHSCVRSKNVLYSGVTNLAHPVD